MSSDITRSEAIKTLKEHLSHWERLLQEHICEEQEGIDTISALKLAIASLETDEAYDLEYEQPEFCKDCISREEVYYYISSHINEIITESGTDKNAHTNAILRSLANGVKLMPRVLPDVDDNNVGELTIHCKDCKFFEYDHFEFVFGVPLIVAHEVCTKWGDACKTNENGACFLAERKESENKE